MRALILGRRGVLVTVGFVACAAAFLLATPATAAAAPSLTVTPTQQFVVGTTSHPVSSTPITITGSGFTPNSQGTLYLAEQGSPPFFSESQSTNASGGFTKPFAHGYPADCFSGSFIHVWSFVDGAGVAATAEPVTFTVNPGGGAPGSDVCPSPTVEFASMSAQAMMLLPRGTANDSVGMVATFKLGTSSNGIDPATQPVKIDIGSQSLTVLPGSFTKTWLGWTYRGQLNGIQWTVVLVRLWDSRYVLTAAATRLDLTRPSVSIDVSIAIGDDSGSTSVHPLVLPRS